jgi:hypothetical protein
LYGHQLGANHAFFIAAVGITKTVAKLVMALHLKQCLGGLFLVFANKFGNSNAHIVINHLAVNTH